LGEAGDGVDVTPVAWAAVGGGAGRSGDGGGKELELKTGISIGLVAWAAVGCSDGGSSEVGGKEIVLGAGAGEEWSWVPHVGVWGCRG
jgi:hypothetical protein